MPMSVSASMQYAGRVTLTRAAAVTGRALVQGSVPEHFMTEPFNFFFQMRLAAPEFDEHLAVFIRAME